MTRHSSLSAEDRDSSPTVREGVTGRAAPSLTVGLLHRKSASLNVKQYLSDSALVTCAAVFEMSPADSR